MRKYIWKRIFFSVVSLLVVVMTVMLLVYSLTDRSAIFQTDDVWNKKNLNDRIIYEYSQYQKYGYLIYETFTAYSKNKWVGVYGDAYDQSAGFNEDKDAIQEDAAVLISKTKGSEAFETMYNKYYSDYYRTYYAEYKAILKSNGYDSKLIAQKAAENAAASASASAAALTALRLSNETVDSFCRDYEGKGYSIKWLQADKYTTGKTAGRTKPGGTGYLIAVREKPVVSRLWEYIKGFFTVETKWDVDDPELTDRYIRFEKDPYSGLFAIVGSGTTHKYLLYFDSKFPFIHQNWIHMNLGISFTRYRGQEISSVITDSQGELKTSLQQYPAQIGTDIWVETASDFHTLTYNTGELSDNEKELFNDKYTNATYRRTGLSMLGNSFIIGLIATFFQYGFGLPLGILMARKKDTWIDKAGMGYIIFFMSVPGLAYIFIFAAIGTRLLGLPYKFANANIRILAYILPMASLAIPSIGGLMKWMRRYMIDQMNSDYVKFARAEGLSEREIYSTHISKNAMIPIIHGVPGNILGCLVGAIITERVYSVPGVGNLLTKAINDHDNGIIIACTVFYTTLSLTSLILGDVLMAKFDPRISFESKGGR